MSPPAALRYYTAPSGTNRRTPTDTINMPDFWRHSGYHLAGKDANGRLLPTDDLLRAYFARPEVAPIAESCANERALFERLMHAPSLKVGSDDLALLADPDARENYAVVLRFRDHLLQSGTLEAAYRGLFYDQSGRASDFAARGLPPMFADQLVQMILRNILADCNLALQLRAGELFFREQRAHVEDGQVLLADAETVEAKAATAAEASGFGNIGRLLAQAQTPLRKIEMDVLGDDNADDYWPRDERHDTALQVDFGRPGLPALCRVIEQWVAHFFDVRVRIEPLRSLDSARMRWYCGLDATSTALMNGIYNGTAPDDANRRRILCMMKLEVVDSGIVAPAPHDTEVYLSLAMDEQGNVRMKPQNLLTNLPFALRV